MIFLSVLAGALALPASAAARSAHTAPAAVSSSTPAPGLTVTLVEGGTDATYVTHAKTVGDFLAERGIVPSSADAVSPALGDELVAGQQVEYRAAVPVQLIVGKNAKSVLTSATDVATLLAQQGITLGSGDSVQPDGSSPVSPGMAVRVTHETVWTALRRQFLPVRTVQRYDARLPAGTTKTLSAGRPGERDITVHFMQRDDLPIQARAIASRIVRHSRPRIIVHGIGEYAAFARLAERGFDATLGLARNALHMIATAYTASCAGCTGYAANGMRAGHGIVAVDPSVIPLGTRLYIPGYGSAIAGDTGGAIVGHRIDLGFDSLMDALQFGRRPITVYVLR
jgi:3D (Asp-Asp-Asp) domain-containing protein